jgi:RimJ/RimL family protein N-acetyltransferase
MTASQNRPVELETERFRLRSLRPADASDRWLGWGKDPDVMGPLNALPRALTRQDLANYIAGFDNNTRYLIGVFEKGSDLHLGFYTITIDPRHRVATFDVVVGDKSWWGKGIVTEAGAALLDYFFEHRQIEKVCGYTLARNFPAILNLKKGGWRHEGTLRGQCKSVLDGSRLDQYQFGLLRDEWRASRRTGGDK